MSALDYFLKANLYGLLFTSCYWFLLRKHTFFSLNRAYLLVSVGLSLLLPLLILPAKTVETLPATIPIGVITLPASTMATPVAETGPDWQQIGLWSYAGIALLLLVRLGLQVGRLMRLIRQSTRHVQDEYVLVQPNNPQIPTFSFFQYVILNRADTRNELILQHELVHVRQYHSADVLGLGILRALFWACPVVWLTDKLLRQVHEFLADKPASQPTEYARFLVAYSFGTKPGLTNPDMLTNSFFTPSLLKQRIMMLHQKATTRWALGKYALVFPLAFSLLAMTTARNEITTVANQALDEQRTISGHLLNSSDGQIIPVAQPPKHQQSNAAPNPQRTTVENQQKRAIPAETAKPATDSEEDTKTFRTTAYPSPSAFVITPGNQSGHAFKTDTTPPGRLIPTLNSPIRIRGRGPLGPLSGEPLYIVDSAAVSSARIQAIDQNEISQIEVLTGEGAANRYGEKGKYGVVIITTKKK